MMIKGVNMSSPSSTPFIPKQVIVARGIKNNNFAISEGILKKSKKYKIISPPP